MQSILRRASTPLASPGGRGRLGVVPRVLLVDDCPLQRLLGLAFLSRWHITPDIAGGGREAVLLAREQDFDMILMDLDMPEVDGFAATTGIREQERSMGRRKRVPV